MFSTELIGLSIYDVCGKYLGKISDLVFDIDSYDLKYIVIARFYLKPLGMGLLRKIIPREFIKILSDVVFVSIPLEALNKFISSAKYSRLREIEKKMLKRDIVSLILYLPITLLLFCFGILLFFSIPGQIMLWTSIILVLYLPVLVFETQYLDCYRENTEIFARLIYKKRVLDSENNIIGTAIDINIIVLGETLSISAISIALTANSKIRSKLIEVYRKGRIVMIPINLIKSIEEDRIVLNTSLDKLQEYVS